VKALLLSVGSREPDVAVLQEKLLLKADGIFGAKTEKEVKTLALRHNASSSCLSEYVRIDGVVDAGVWSAAGLSAYTRRVPVALFANIHLVTPARQSTMLRLFGEPRSESMPAICSNITNIELAKRMLYGFNVGPFRASGMKQALSSLIKVFGELVVEEPNLYSRLSSAGMLCCRAVRGSTKNWSNHSWGTAIDLKIDGMLDPYADGYCQFGLECAARIFNRHGWYWGAEFSREDAMHFEAGEELVRSWA
jgi:hypothetical protein